MKKTSSFTLILDGSNECVQPIGTKIISKDNFKKYEFSISRYLSWNYKRYFELLIPGTYDLVIVGINDES